MILKQKKFIFLLIFTGLIILFLFLVIQPLFSNIKKQSEDIIAQKNYYAQLQKRKDNFQELKRLTEQYQKEIEKINYLFVDPEKPTDFNNFLEKTGQQSLLKIEITNIQPSKPEPDKWNSLNYQIVLTGSFSNVLSFLDKIENCPYLVEIISLNIKENEDEFILGRNEVEAEIAIKAYTK